MNQPSESLSDPLAKCNTIQYNTGMIIIILPHANDLTVSSYAVFRNTIIDSVNDAARPTISKDETIRGLYRLDTYRVSEGLKSIKNYFFLRKVRKLPRCTMPRCASTRTVWHWVAPSVPTRAQVPTGIPGTERHLGVKAVIDAAFCSR